MQRGLAVLAMMSASEFAEAAYKLDWEAKGKSFFDGWHFDTIDENHGAAEYLPRDRAVEAGVVKAFDTHAILTVGGRAGNSSRPKRQSAKLISKGAWKNFLLVMRYSHLPYGCGLWPALWTLGAGGAGEWPNGGELDFMEWANELPQEVSLHVGHGNRCKLDPELVNKYGKMEDLNNMSYDCVTDYMTSELGCAPNRPEVVTGEEWSKAGGVLAVQKTASFAKVFHIPEVALPAGIDSDSPDPDKWDSKFVVAYFPFADSEAKNPGSCPNPQDVMTEQNIIMNINMCGDWAGGMWSQTSCKDRYGPQFPGECKISDPLRDTTGFEKDCCTMFMHDADETYGADAFLKESAYFNMSYVKVFQEASEKNSGLDTLIV